MFSDLNKHLNKQREERLPKKKSERAAKAKPKLKALKGELKGEPMHFGEPMKFSHGAQHAPRNLHANKTRAA